MSICRVDRPCMRGVQHWESEIERAMWQRGSDTVSPRKAPIIPQGSLLGNTGCLAGQLPCAEVWTQFSRLSSVTCRIKVLNARAAVLWTLFLLMGFLTPQAASLGFSGGSNCKEICLQYRRPGFHPWVRRAPWRRKGQPTPGLWLGEFHGQRSLVGYSPCGQEEWDMTAPPSGGLITFRGHTSSFLPAVVAGGHPCLSTRL